MDTGQEFRSNRTGWPSGRHFGLSSAWLPRARYCLSAERPNNAKLQYVRHDFFRCEDDRNHFGIHDIVARRPDRHGHAIRRRLPTHATGFPCSRRYRGGGDRRHRHSQEPDRGRMRNGPRPCVPPDPCPVSKSETYDLNDRVGEGSQVPEAHAPMPETAVRS